MSVGGTSITTPTTWSEAEGWWQQATGAARRCSARSLESSTPVGPLPALAAKSRFSTGEGAGGGERSLSLRAFSASGPVLPRRARVGRERSAVAWEMARGQGAGSSHKAPPPDQADQQTSSTGMPAEEPEHVLPRASGLHARTQCRLHALSALSLHATKRGTASAHCALRIAHSTDAVAVHAQLQTSRGRSTSGHLPSILYSGPPRLD
ncbi:hypothetical protein P154DRAFT_570126 [Amniculicola lignicola CBS 123094]|uniref:Uncharacterized protein n=1 Tax=Amniculicola lignicola CBS 123094 TaxID=1392246 RepID=A0A6A5X0A9_9PLEO|nr:hypothetical protein P154DRAFT_570126 [Amniculicola lignicola CBS 123094]